MFEEPRRFNRTLLEFIAAHSEPPAFNRGKNGKA
jgi:hypothetical protein